MTKTGNGTFRVSGGNMDIAENAIVFGDATVLDAMNTMLKAAGRGREFYQLAGSTHTIRADRVWKGVANLGYGARDTGYDPIASCPIRSKCPVISHQSSVISGLRTKWCCRWLRLWHWHPTDY